MIKSYSFNYISYVIAYFVISLINTFLILYLPLLLLEVLKINRLELALIQFFSYLILLFGPITAIFFEKFSHYKIQIIYTSGFFLFLSFSFFVFNLDNLILFGIFLSLNFISRLIIKVGMSKLMLDNLDDDKFKKNMILISNLSTSFGAIFPILIFNLVFINYENISLWKIFIFLCWFASFPMIFLKLFLKDPKEQQKLLNIIKSNSSDQQKRTVNIKITLSLAFISNFLIWADKLIEFPYIAWILSRFGIVGLRMYSYSFFIYTYLNMAGWLIARKMSTKKRYNLKISCSILSYSLIFFFMIFSNLPIFLILSALNHFLSGIMMSHFTEKNVDVSRLSKNHTLSYEIIRGSYCIASLIFIPLGTLLSNFIPIEALILIVVFISTTSILPFYFIKT